jgi:hypothetical protein
MRLFVVAQVGPSPLTARVARASISSHSGSLSANAFPASPASGTPIAGGFLGVS